MIILNGHTGSGISTQFLEVNGKSISEVEGGGFSSLLEGFLGVGKHSILNILASDGVSQARPMVANSWSALQNIHKAGAFVDHPTLSDRFTRPRAV